MRVMVAMSGGVDSSVAAALLLDQGHEVVGVTMKLWGGESDNGCCSVADTVDARRAADVLGIDHHVFNFGEEFDRDVIGHYVKAHEGGLTPNPCIECNRSIKFAKLYERSLTLGFDAVATGHHCRITTIADGTKRLTRAVDMQKDQSYVLHMVTPKELERVLFPVGDMPKSEVREIAKRFGIGVANKPDSQDVCFIASTVGRKRFLETRMQFSPGTVVDEQGSTLGKVESIQMVTIGQRKGLGIPGGTPKAYVYEVDHESGVIKVGPSSKLMCELTEVDEMIWAAGHPHELAESGELFAQTSAHGKPERARVLGNEVHWCEPHRRVAPGQTVVIYEGDLVVGGAIATS